MSQRRTQSSQQHYSSQTPQGTPRSQPGVSGKETQELAKAAVRYILANDYDKVPIKHNDILNALKNMNNNFKNSGQIMQIAGRMLREVYGMKLIEYGQSNNKLYFVVNNIDQHEHLIFSPVTDSEMILLSIILCFIFMQTNGRWREIGVEQGKVYKFLQLLDIDVTEQHAYFGDVKKVMTNLESQRYLSLVKMENTNPVLYEYRWGIRAIEEVSPREALTFASEMYGRERIESWAAHYNAVVDFEGTRRVQ